MEIHKPKFGKNTNRGTRDDRRSGYRGSRDDRSSGYNRDSRSGGSRFNRNDNGSRFNRGSEDNRSRETYKATCGDCGNECQIPFKPKYDRPVYCKECFQDHKPQERSGDSRFNRGPSYGRNDRSSGYRGPRDDRSSGYRGPRDDRSSSYRGPRNYRRSGYNQGPSRFQKDRTPIYSRDNFRTTKYPSKNEESYKKNSNDYFPNNSNSFYSTLRTKLFTVLGEKKCVNCGFDDERALGFGQTDDVASFDYIQRAGTASSWEKYISDPDLAKKELQVICLNCNMIKQKN